MGLLHRFQDMNISFNGVTIQPTIISKGIDHQTPKTRVQRCSINVYFLPHLQLVIRMGNLSDGT
jgi:hypothetical protein